MSGYYILRKDGSVVESFNTKEAAEAYLLRLADRDELRIESRGIVTFVPMNNTTGRLH